MPFLMIRDDITRVQAEALVNPANERLLEGSGVSRAIYLAAGEEKLEKACRRIGHCPVGQVVATKAFDLPAKYIIHAAGPVWRDGSHGEQELLYSAYMESMLLAARRRLRSIAFPLLSAGNNGYPREQALRTAVHAISDFLTEHEMLVYLVLYDRSAVLVSRKLFAAIDEYIDDHYVEEKDELYPGDGRQRGSFSGAFFGQGNGTEQEACVSRALEPAPAVPSRKRSLDELMEHMGETFSQMLLRLIDERNLKDSQVYKRANVDRRHFSKIRRDKNYTPNKKTVLAFAIALELSLDETKDLLMRAGYAFSMCSKFDVIVCYFIENKQYDIFQINEALFAYEQPVLGA